MKYSIKDNLNLFGASDSSGEFPNTIYVGNKGMTTDPKFNAEGGQITIPYFVEFIGGANLTAAVTLSVFGKDEEEPDSAYREVGKLEIPANTFQTGTAYRVAVSESGCKTFKCKASAAGITACLFRG